MPTSRPTQQRYFEFALWAIALGRPVTFYDVQGFFQISVVSAKRLHRHWMLAVDHHASTSSSTLPKGRFNGQ